MRNQRSLLRSLPLGLLLGAILCMPAMAVNSVAEKYVTSAKLVGKGRLHVFMFKVFDARLYAPEGEFDPTRPFALSLSYLRSIDSASIVDSTIKELRKQRSWDANTIEGWREALAGIIPDVDPETTITGVRTDAGATHFYQGEQMIGEISDPSFTAAFFDIWLGDTTSQPQLRRELLQI